MFPHDDFLNIHKYNFYATTKPLVPPFIMFAPNPIKNSVKWVQIVGFFLSFLFNMHQIFDTFNFPFICHGNGII